jgi:two-component sensor histidine kinase
MHAEPAEELRDFVVSTHKAYEEVQHRVDERLQTVLATVRHMAPVFKEVDRLREEVRQLSDRVHYLETHLPLTRSPDDMAS